MMRVLWVCRTLPFPTTAGDRITSANLSAALAAAGAVITFTGFQESSPPDKPGVEWRVVPGKPRSNLRGLLGLSPLVTARHTTKSYLETIQSLTNGRGYDAVIIDYHAMGWILKHQAAFAQPRPIFVYMTHNHEASVTKLQWQDPNNSLAVRAFHFQNYLKTLWYERRLLRACDLVTAVTPTDAALFKKDTSRPPLLLLSAYGGARVAERTIDDGLPRTILLFGSYQWSAKQASLLAFLECADGPLAAAGIKIRVVGDMSESFKASLVKRRYQAAEIIGRVDDPAPYLSGTRLAIVADTIGGGFKMKLLEFLFNRIPVAALDGCTAGLPDEIRKHMLLRDDLDGLVKAIVEVADDTERLNLMQNGAFSAANNTFVEWKERGREFYAAIEQTRATFGG